MGRLAKTDPLDASMLAELATVLHRRADAARFLRPLADADRQRLAAMVARRRQLLSMLTSERLRLATAYPAVRASINAAIQSIRKHAPLFETITADNGTEFHDYKGIEQRTPVTFYFTTPHHSWERGTNENTNGLIRQYLPKGASMTGLTQQQCHTIAHKLNTRPRKRLDFKTPPECCHAN